MVAMQSKFGYRFEKILFISNVCLMKIAGGGGISHIVLSLNL